MMQFLLILMEKGFISSHSCRFNRSHFEIFQYNRCSRIINDQRSFQKQQDSAVFKIFESFAHNNTSTGFYKSVIKESVEEDGYEYYVSFVSREHRNLEGIRETISINLKCTNHNLPELLGIGDICMPSQNTPSYIEFKKYNSSNKKL